MGRRDTNRHASHGGDTVLKSPADASFILKCHTTPLPPRILEAAERTLAVALQAVDRRELPVVRDGDIEIDSNDQTVVVLKSVSAGVNPNDSETDARTWTKLRVMQAKGGTITSKTGRLTDRNGKSVTLFQDHIEQFEAAFPNQEAPAYIEYDKKAGNIRHVYAAVVTPDFRNTVCSRCPRLWVPRPRVGLRSADMVLRTPPQYNTCMQIGRALVQSAKKDFPGTVVLQNVDLFWCPPPVDVAKLIDVVGAWRTRQGPLLAKQRRGQCTQLASYLFRILTAQNMHCLKCWLFPEECRINVDWEYHVFLVARDAFGEWFGIDPWWVKYSVLPIAEMLRAHTVQGIVGVDVSSPEQPFPLTMFEPTNGNRQRAEIIMQRAVANGYQLLPDDVWANFLRPSLPN